MNFNLSIFSNLNTPEGRLDYRKFAFPVTSLVVSIVAFFTVVIPQAIELSINQAALTDLQTQVDNLDAKVAALSNISTPEFESNLNTVTQALPVTKDYIDSTSYLQNAIDKSKVTLTGLSFSEVAPTGDVESYKVKVDISGSLTSANQFLSLINRSPRTIRVSRIELNSDAGNFDATVFVTAFYAPIQKQNLSLTQPVVALTDQELEQILQLSKNLKADAPKNPTEQVGRSDPFN